MVLKKDLLSEKTKERRSGTKRGIKDLKEALLCATRVADLVKAVGNFEAERVLINNLDASEVHKLLE